LIPKAWKKLFKIIGFLPIMEEERGFSYLRWKDVAFMTKINNNRAIPTPPLISVRNTGHSWLFK
jgi:hypothetical protein